VNPAAVFADTLYWIALMSVGDPAHEVAVQAGRINRPIITTECVILELGNACHRALDRPDFLKLAAGLRDNPRVVLHSL
jgi:hypothetical protein